MIHVIAIITAHPGHRDALLTAFHANMPAVHAEAGCVEYEPATDTADAGAMQAKLGDDTFVVIEKWADLDALKAHAGSAHMAAYAARTKQLIAKRTIHVLSPA